MLYSIAENVAKLRSTPLCKILLTCYRATSGAADVPPWVLLETWKRNLHKIARPVLIYGDFEKVSDIPKYRLADFPTVRRWTRGHSYIVLQGNLSVPFQF